MDSNVLKKEKLHLKTTLQKLESAKNQLELDMQQMGIENLDTLKDLRQNPETSGADLFFFLEQLNEKNIAFNLKDKLTRMEELDSLLNSPYFSRIDLHDNDHDSAHKVYIGKFGYTEGVPVVTDWRAKVASVYYRYRYPQKNVKYETPEGTVVRDLKLKRTFEIEEGHLIKYYNNDLQLDENEIIAEKIEQRTGGVLEDIIETIQSSQMDIIESDPRQVCIVQGSVGSGKSTVAIHKLSHIFFNYPQLIHPERSILIAQNQILVGYLSTLFPKLGIFNINYKTLRDLVFNVVFREEFKISIDFDLPDSTTVTLKEISDIDRIIAKVHKEYEKKIKKIFTEGDFESFAGFVYNPKQTVYENLKEAISDLEEELNFQKEYLKDNPNSPKEWLYKSNISDLRSLLTKLTRLNKELFDETLIQIYSQLGISLKEKLSYSKTLLYIYVYSEIVGIRNVEKFEYCVVDEGQDFSILEYLVLSKLVLKGRFCILGDLNQGYQEEGITDWKDIQKVIKDAKNANTFEMTTNYRSTKPIIDLANKILKPYTKKYLPKSINRKGEDPCINNYSTKPELLEVFRESIVEETKDINKSIGIICQNDDIYKGAEKILDSLKLPEDIYIKLDSKKRVHYIPRGVYLMRFEDCKGLEFAKVYVLDLNLDAISDFTEAKRAFVSVTRAMNELSIFGVN